MEEESNDFEEVNEEGKPLEPGQPVPEGGRVRLPRKGEVIGVVMQRFGGNRMEVLGTDGKKRNCRVPGRYKRMLWLRPKDTVLIFPWEDDDGKADIIFKYNPGAVNQLRRKGMLKDLQDTF